MNPPDHVTRLIELQDAGWWACPTCLPRVRVGVDQTADGTAVTQVIRHAPGCRTAALWLANLGIPTNEEGVNAA